MRLFHNILLTACLLAVSCVSAHAQWSGQRADTDFAFANATPAYPAGKGPVIVFSSENSEFVQHDLHLALDRLAQGDGFRTRVAEGRLTPDLLEGAGLLVLINPYVPEFRDRPAMDPPSAYSDEEINAVVDWVKGGGALLILADHAPFGGGSSSLAAAFGFTFLNGHVADAAQAENDYVHVEIDFTPDNGLNTTHAITDGGTGRPAIGLFHAFGGQAFIPADDAVTLLRIPQGWTAIFSYRIRQELRSAPRIDAGGMAQGAVLEYGKGRVAVFGETGGFNAQVRTDAQKVGFNTPEGKQNPEFILSVLRWLARFKPAQ